MPQIIALAVASTIVYAGYKWIVKKNALQSQKMREKAQQTNQPRDLGRLDWDEADGVYRPRR